MPSYGVCPSVCLSVTFVDCVKFFSPSGSQHHSNFFPYQMMWKYSDGDRPNGGVECRWDRQTSRCLANIWQSDRRLLECEQQLRRTIVQFTAHKATHRYILFIAACSMDDDDEEKRTEQNLIVRIGKSEAEVTNKRKLRPLYCTIEANY